MLFNLKPPLPYLFIYYKLTNNSPLDTVKCFLPIKKLLFYLLYAIPFKNSITGAFP